MAGEIDAVELMIGDGDALWVFVGVEFGANLQAFFCRWDGDDLDDGLVGAQGLAAPVDRNERKELVFDFVPLAGAWRQVTNGDGDFQLVRQFLQFDFPDTNARSIAAAAIGGDYQAFGLGKTFLSHRDPPAADRLNRESRRVMIVAYLRLPTRFCWLCRTRHTAQRALRLDP